MSWCKIDNIKFNAFNPFIAATVNIACWKVNAKKVKPVFILLFP